MVHCGASVAQGTGGTATVSVYATGHAPLVSAFCAASLATPSFKSILRRNQAGSALCSIAARNGVLRSRGRRRRRLSDLRCDLTRLSGDAGHKVLPSLATRDQWAHYWGGSDTQRVGKFFEVSAVAFLGLWACYFTSFFLGVGTTSLIGASFLFYWLLAPNVTAFRRNRALRGTIAPYPGGDGNSVAILSARVASATEEYHPITGEAVFLRMVIEDEDGRALKFRTRTRAEYARVRPGMVAEALLVSPDENFEEIVGVSDTYIPAAKVWVGEYPYVDKVVMRRLLASRDSKKRRRNFEYFEDEDGEDGLDPMAYRDAWTQTGPEAAWLEGAPRSFDDEEGFESDGASDYYYEDEYDDDGDEPRYQGWGSSGFSSSSSMTSSSSLDGQESRIDSDAGGGGVGGRRQWERVSGRPKPRRRPPPPPAATTTKTSGAFGETERQDWSDSYFGRGVRQTRRDSGDGWEGEELGSARMEKGGRDRWIDDN